MALAFTSDQSESFKAILGKNYSTKVYNYMKNKGVLKSNNVPSIKSFIRQHFSGLANNDLYVQNIVEAVAVEQKKQERLEALTKKILG